MRVTLSNLNGNKTTNLSQIALSTFNGQHEDWLAFANKFKTSIYNNQTLDACKQLNHLKSCLQGEPASLVSSVNITASNYALAWLTLEKCYNQSKMIVEKHLKAIRDLPKMQRASYTELAHFVNVAQTNSRSIVL